MRKVLTQGTFDWDRAVTGFLVSRRVAGCSPSTLAFYAGSLDRFRRWLTGSFPGLGPLDLQPDHVRAFFDYLLAEPVRFGGQAPNARRPITPHGLHRYYRALRTFFNWLEAELGRFLEGWVNPMTRVKAPKLPVRPIPCLTSEQVRRLIEAVRASDRNRDRNLAMVLILLDKGLRASELLGLTLDDWDWATGTLIIRRAKGGKFRQVVLHPTANQALKKYVFGSRPESDARELFLSEEGVPLQYDGLRMVLRRLGEAAGIPGLRPHLLRHTFALHWVTAGGSLHELQALLGHSSPVMSLQYGRMVSDRVDPDRQARFSPIAGFAERRPRRRPVETK
jgi:site-specific recombinase XerD